MFTNELSNINQVEQLAHNGLSQDALDLFYLLVDRVKTSENRVNSLKAQNKQLTADLHDEVLSRIHWEKRFKQLKKQTGQ